MNPIPFSAFACPLDGLSLIRHGTSLKCANNHNFDFDRKGTINLLPVQFKKSLNPGDSKEMVDARQRFLDTGFYQPISDKLNELVSKSIVIFDAGCGEGYYTDRLVKYLSDQEKTDAFSIIGMDISKFAINAAARRNKDVSWIVGTNAKIPVLDQSIDCVTSLFGFPVWSEFKRILKPGGKVIIAEPGPDHLIELRRILYPEIKEKLSEKTTPEGFTEVAQERLRVSIVPPSPEFLEMLIMMTPHGYRSIQEKIREAIHHSYDGLTIDILFSIYHATVSL